MNLKSDPTSDQTSSLEETVEAAELIVLDAYRAACQLGEIVTPERFIEAYPNARGALPALQALAAIYKTRRAAEDMQKLTEAAFPTIATATPLSLPIIPGYEMEKEIARGGMGVVYKAKQLGTLRPVAIKMILAGQLNELGVERFLREGKLVAGLRHPNIVSVFEVGQVDGQPFFSMEFVDGGSLYQLSPKEALLPVRQAAEYIRTIAKAVQYAHDMDILHRDIKPSNVLIDSAGQPRVMDFGLARPIEGISELTGSGDAVGTPSYMSPEQAAGRRNKIGPRSDVYSLGATLYYLLTGRPPFRAETAIETLREVQDEDPVSLRSLRQTLARDLETICVTALAKEPARRYQSAQLLAEDLGRYLAGEPIMARPVSTAERAFRWAKKYPRVAGLSAAVFLLLITIAVVVGQSNRSLSLKNLALKAANELADRNEQDAIRNAKVAREQSQIALKALTSVIFDIQRGLQDVPGAGGVRRSLLDSAQAGLQELSDRFIARSEIDRNSMVVLNELGDLFLRFGSGTAGATDADGPVTSAHKVYQKAFDIAEKLATNLRSDAQAERDLSICCEKLGNLLLQSGRVTDALKYYQQEHRIRQKLVFENPDDTQANCDLSFSYDHLGHMWLRSNEHRKAIEAYSEGVKIRQKLVSRNPKDDKAWSELSISFDNIGNVQLQSEQVTEALESYRNGMEIRLRLVEAKHNDPQALRDLSVSYGKLGNALIESEKKTAAVESFQKGLEICQKLAKLDQSDKQAQRDLSVAYNKLGDVQRQFGEFHEAMGSYQEGLKIRQGLAVDNRNSQAQSDLSVSYSNVGDVLLQTGKLNEALASYQLGLEIIQKIAKDDPYDAQTQHNLSVMYEKLGDARFRSGQLTEALNCFNKRFEISEKLLIDPNDAEGQINLVVGLTKIGSVKQEQKHYAEAIETYGRGLKLLDSLKEQKKLSPEKQTWIEPIEEAISQCRKLRAEHNE